jgi:hypothetical protein
MSPSRSELRCYGSAWPQDVGKVLDASLSPAAASRPEPAESLLAGDFADHSGNWANPSASEGPRAAGPLSMMARERDALAGPQADTFRSHWLGKPSCLRLCRPPGRKETPASFKAHRARRHPEIPRDPVSGPSLAVELDGPVEVIPKERPAVKGQREFLIGGQQISTWADTGSPHRRTAEFHVDETAVPRASGRRELDVGFC